MITTVTITTTAALTSSAASLSLIVILTFLALLIVKEIASGLKNPVVGRVNRAFSVVVVPLIIVFLSTLVFKVADVLR